MTPSNYNYPKSNKLQQQYPYNHHQSNYNRYPNNFNNSYSLQQYNINNYSPYYEQQYYPQCHQYQAHYYQSYYQHHPNESYHQNPSNPNNLNKSYHNQDYAYIPQVPTQNLKNTSLNQSYQQLTKQHKNSSQYQFETKDIQNNFSKSVVYHPGQQTNTYGHIPKEVGLPNWQNPYKDCSFRRDQSRDHQYRNQHSSKVRMYREKPELQVNQSFTDSLNSSFLSEVSFKPEDRGMQGIGRFGGVKKKKKRQNVDQSVASIQTISAKKKQKSLAEQSSNMGYFTVKTEYVQTVKCPFDSSHIMQPSRLLTHISRCILKCQTAKQYVMCPYDPTHYYRFNQIEAHKNTCDKKPQYVMEDFWNIGVDNLNQSTRPDISIYNKSESNNKERQAAPASEPSNLLIREDPERTKFENYLITDF